jgi:hypothetical protein
MRHFFIVIICVLVGVTTGLLLSKVYVAPYIEDKETLAPRNGLILYENSGGVKNKTISSEH